MTKQKKITIIFISVIILVFVFYFSFHGWFIAYTSDAYMRGNVMIVSPRVDGHVLKVYVQNSQYIKKGDHLLDLDPTPYQLKLSVKKSTLKEAETELLVQKSNYETAENKLKALNEEFRITQIQFERYDKLSKTGAVSKQSFEDKVAHYDQVKNELADAEQKCEYWQETINAQMSEIDAARSQVALAEYYLKQTKIYSPADGCVINCNVRPGDYANQGTGLFSVIENTEWWVNANYKESVIRKIKPGQKVYIYTGLYPFRIFNGVVKCIARGTSRNKYNEKVLPYIEPTTDWIRLQRRFSVIVNFDKKIPDDVLFCEGANAKCFIIL